MHKNVIGKDLTKEPPRSPRVRVGGYAILGRTIDKSRALVAGNIGEYHFDCPLDNMLFGFKGVKGADVKPLLASGATDEEIAAWLDTHGTPNTAAEVKAWSDSIETINPYNDPAKREWFAGECAKLGLKPENTTLVKYLET